MEKLIVQSESAHWYDKNGNPHHTVIGKNGKERPTTIRDARELGLLPSVTSILRLLDKPGLQAWKQQQIVLAALTLPRNDGESADDYAKRVVKDAEEHAKEAADKGTAIHAAIQKYYETGDISAEVVEKYQYEVSAVAEAMRGISDEPWIIEKSFSAYEGYAGKVDSYSGNIVVDWKTTAFDSDHRPKGYPEHCYQLAAYAFGLGITNPVLVNIYISTTVPGLVHVVEWSRNDALNGLMVFRHLFEIWKIVKGYDPRG